MKLFLVRHGRSVANDDKILNATMGMHAIPLSGQGFRQAKEAGKAIKRYLDDTSVDGFKHVDPTEPATMIVSPYVRTRQTADQIQSVLGLRVEKRIENINLVEQQFGLFDGMGHEETEKVLRERYPHEFAHYDRCVETKGKFWARTPMGESHFDVARRVQDAITAIKLLEAEGVNLAIVVSHSYTISAFLMQWFGHPYEWTYTQEARSKNCQVRVLDEKKLETIHAGATL